ncbi:UDP-2,4-diacetamido-2,4,6-trideoxy-beta-L-altropyranose hydrolase [Candidatus Magnetominusculus dajiuhuensis]|uniref:UDP-2,4-diacetamido-2,4, 6-trideoxy-beta-L-altropyranose hydrolase n=1 Tax=Candidatus Magnetominusculus dajiuhuensis TaxID=3137712 RepID=UPI001A080C6A|nr:UDP-2,4-diacetamido-2,4,6-trideoxy-beta-L-altropyranose hydrolase [Nitrospirota bacterium]
MDVVIRADAYPEIGTGHLMRCMALGQSFKDRGWRVVFITYCEAAGLLGRLTSEDGFNVIPLESKSDNVLPPCHWAVVDGVNFDGRFHKSMKDAGYKLLIIDDMAALKIYDGEFVLNQNIHADSLKYNLSPGTRLLSGPEYILLRREFIKHRGVEKLITDKCVNVLITLGGADRENLTQKVLNSVKDINDIKITVVVGAGNPNIESIKTVGTAAPVTILQNVANMADVMASQDAAVTSGGTTVWELAFMGVPSVVGRIAPIEDYLVAGLNSRGLFIDSGWFKTATEDEIRGNLLKLLTNMKLRKEMSALGRRLVDGFGRDRVIEAMEAI